MPNFDSISEDKLCAARILAVLCEKYPTLHTISSMDALGISPPYSAFSDFDRLEIASGILTFLHRNGYISGEMQRLGGGGVIILDAQLTPSGRSVLAPHNNVGGQHVGVAASEALASGDARALAISAELIDERLSGR